MLQQRSTLIFVPIFRTKHTVLLRIFRIYSSQNLTNAHTHTHNFITNTKLLFISRLSLQNYLNRTTTRDFRTNFIRTIEWLLHIYHSYIILICFHFMASTSHRMCIDVYLKLFGAAGSLLSIGPFHFFMGFYAVSFHFQFCTFNFLLPTHHYHIQR